jgi:membrane fusion protein (multidrug efflux system)
MDVVSLDDVWITANFKETQLGHLRPGQPVEIKVDAYGRSWKGHVTSLGGAAGSVLSAIPCNSASNPQISNGCPFALISTVCKTRTSMRQVC